MQLKLKQIFILFLLITFFLGMYLYVFNEFSIDKKKLYEQDDFNEITDCPNLLVRKNNKYYLKYSDDKKETIVFENLNEYIKHLEKERNHGKRCPVLYLQEENDLQGNDVYKIRPNPFSPNEGISKSPYIYLNSEIENFDTESIVNALKQLNSRPGTNLYAPTPESPAPHAPAPPAPPAPAPAAPPAPAPPAPPAPPEPPAPPAPPAPAAPVVKEENKKVVNVKDASISYPPYNSNQYNGFDSHGQYIGVYTNVDKIHESTKKDVISDNPMDPNWGGVLYTQQMVDSGKYTENNVTRTNYYTPKNGQFYPFAVNNPTIPPP
jgi:hypothetical protein